MVLYIVLGWTLTTVGCYAAGSLLMARLGDRWSREESVALRFVAGAGVYSLLVFLLGILHLYYRATFVALPLGLALAAWRMGALALPGERLTPLPLLWRRILWITAPFTLLYLSNAMAPEVSPDGASYHLGLVAKYYRERAMVPVTTNLYAALSQGMEMLFLAAYAVGRHSAAALMHFNYLLTLPWLLLCYGRRYGMAGAGMTAALLVYLSPVVGLDGISAYNDVAAACLWFALFTVLRRIEDLPESRGLAVLAGVLAGSAYGLKYTLFPALLFAGVWIIWVYRKMAMRPILLLAAGALPSIAPWVIRNTIWWANPLAPFFNKLFPNPYVTYWFELDYRRHMSMYSLTSLTEIPMQVTVHGADLNGLLGPVYLLAPFALLALRFPEGRRVLAAALFALAAYPSNIGTRFLIPALPLVAMGMAMTFNMVRWLPAAVVVIHAVLSWPNAIPAYASKWAWRLEKVTWKEALRLRSEDNYILSHIPAYGLTRKLEELVPAGRRVLGFSQLPEAYTNRDYMVGFQSAEGGGLRDIFVSALAEERQPRRLAHLFIPSARHKALRVVQNRDDSGGQWSVTEMRFYSGGKEVPRSPLWRLRAKPTLHDVQRAFDGSPITRWISDQGRYNGMYIEVDFGMHELVDDVVLLLTPDQPLDTYHVEARGADGKWEKVKTELKLVEVTTMPGMRRAAVEELLRRNVQYLVLSESDFGCDDLVLNKDVWGVEQLANVADVRLFRLIPREEFEARRKGAK
ncbi:MAG: hypothetical protein HYX27_10470 [Acidobacteria bacterium]|nr:hypothetical protein [Acidobacteriota bacterium]